MQRHEIIQSLIDARGYKSFLEIGTYRGDCFNRIACPVKESVDPDPEAHATYQMTSDEFFASLRRKPGTRYDLIFIDGLHEHSQAWRDICNSLWALHDGGTIVMHDCLPESEKMQEWCNHSRQGEIWTGDVWKAYLKALHSLPFLVYVVDCDWGCGVLDTTRPSHVPFKEVDMDALAWKDYSKDSMNVRGDVWL